MARSLGLDIGNRRIGVATSDTLKLIARPLEVIDRKSTAANVRIAALIAAQQADEVIVGYPYNADGSSGEQSRRVEQFVAQLRGFLGESVPFHFCDERYSTLAAREIAETGRGGGKKRKGQPASDDAIAAAVILQRWLDARRSQQAQQAHEPAQPDEEDFL